MANNSSLYGSTPPSGTVSSSNYTTLYSGGNNFVPSGDNVIISGTLTVNGCAILTDCPTFSLLPFNATTVNAFGSATAVSIGGATGVTTIQNQLSTGNYLFPLADGTTNQILATDGNGFLYWADTQSLDTNYTIQADTATGGANLTLVGSDSTTDSVKFANGSGIQVTRTDANTITITNTDPGSATVTSITGTANQIIASASTGAVTLSTPQDIATTSSPTFEDMLLNGSLTVNLDGTGSDGVIYVNSSTGSPQSTLRWNGVQWIFDDNVYITQTSATFANRVAPLAMTAQSSGTTAVGFATSLDYVTESTYSGNLNSGYISVRMDDNTAGSEDFSMRFGLMKNGATYDAKAILDSSGNLILDGGITVSGSTSGSSTFNAPATGSTLTYTLPGSAGAANTVLTNNGSGVLSWAVATPVSYTIDATTTTGGANFNLTGSDASVDTIKFASGGSTTVTRTDANTITISSVDTNTTYTQNASATTGGANLNLVGSDATTDTIKFASGTGISVSRTDDSTITITNTAPEDAYTIDATATTGGANLNLSNSAATDSVAFKGTGATTVTRTSADVITVSSTDTNTTYTQNASATTGGANLNLVGSDATTDTVKFQSGTNVTVAQVDANTISISTTGITPTDVQQVFATVRNQQGSTITIGQVVYLFGATGNTPTVKLADNGGDPTSAKSLGLVYDASINNGAQGLVITQGLITGVNTASFAEGDSLYLGSTPGSVTNVKPSAPDHLVYIGVVVKSNVSTGQIFVRVQNGYELGEIHDVDLVTNPPTNNQVLTYVAATDLWTAQNTQNIFNQTLNTTDSPTFAGVTAGNITVGVATDNKITTTTGDLIIEPATGDLDINAIVNISGDYLNLNSDDTANDAAIRFGNSSEIRYNRTDNRFEFNKEVYTSNNISLDGGLFNIYGSTSGYSSFSAPATGSNLGYVLPGSAGAANTVLTNDGSGNLSWALPGGGGSTFGNISIGVVTDNTIGSTNTNGDIILQPNGNGDVSVAADTLFIGDGGASTFITTNGAGTLYVNTNNGTNTGSIFIEQGVNGNIVLEPYATGTGAVKTYNNFVVDEGVLFVNATTNRVGINNTNPQYELHIDQGADAFTQIGMTTTERTALWTMNDGDDLFSFSYGATPGTPNRLQFDPTNQWFNSGRLGVNNNAPTATLDVTGDGKFSGDVAVNGGDITTTATIANIFNTTATQLNIGEMTGSAFSTSNVINIGTNGITYSTEFGGLITQNGFTTQAASRFPNITSTSPQLIMSTTRRSMKCVVTVTDDVTGAVHSVECLVVSKPTTSSAYLTIYAEIFSDAPLATFTATYTGSSIYLYATPASTNSTDISILRNSLGD